MDPLSPAIGGKATTAGTRLLVQAMRKATRRWAIVRAVAKAAQREGIRVDRRMLSAWLRRDDVRSKLDAGDVQPLAVELGEMLGANPGDGVGEQLTRLVLDETLRRKSTSDALVEVAQRAERAPLIFAGSAGEFRAFEDAVATLHPWRRREAVELAEQWTPMRRLVIALCSNSDKRQTLEAWYETRPSLLDSAPAAVLCWLATVAGDHDVNAFAVALIEDGISVGAPASYWLARAGLMVGTATNSSAAEARELWRRSQPPHVLASALIATDEGRLSDAEEILRGWSPTGDQDPCVKALLLMGIAVQAGETNRAIAMGEQAATDFPESSGIPLRTAHLLIARGHHGPSDAPLEDFARARDYARKARDSRREWAGDSVPAVLLGIQAAALGGDPEGARRMSRRTPHGEATESESSDRRVRRESAMLAAYVGDLGSAKELAAELNDPFVQSMVDGWVADARGDSATAEAEWMGAFEHAPDSVSRVQAAAALAPLGRSMPDLSGFEDEFGDSIQRLRGIHSAMSSTGDRLAVLRARASESEQLTVLLAQQLADRGEDLEAAAALVRGARQWASAPLMKMAAKRYAAGGAYEDALAVANETLSLGGARWAGRFEVLTIQFDALEALGRRDESLACLRAMVAMAPENASVRWALVNSLVRRGDIADAWNALAKDGEPIGPRRPEDARLWIGLAAECDDTLRFLPRSLKMMEQWVGDADVTAVFLLQIYRGLQRRDTEVDESDLAVLHAATQAFTEQHPNHSTFRSVDIDVADPLSSLASELRSLPESDALKELRLKIQAGLVPLGFLCELHSRSYVEACVRRSAGMVYSHAPGWSHPLATVPASPEKEAVVIDGSAAVTLSLLDETLVNELIGRFSSVNTTDVAYRDSLDAQQSLGMRSSLSIRWDDDAGRVVAYDIGEEAAERFATSADRTVELLARAGRLTWPRLVRFSDFGGEGAWLNALDCAAEAGHAFWCDDRVLRQLAIEQGVQTFGTVDLVAEMVACNQLDEIVAKLTLATLVHNYYVDIEFDADVVQHAAELDGWNPAGSAHSLSRVGSWKDPEATLRFALKAMEDNAAQSPGGVSGWVTTTALGLIRIAGNAPAAAGNLQLLLGRIIQQPWLRPDLLPFVMAGIREAMREDLGVTDPLGPVLQVLRETISSEQGAKPAAEFLMMFVASLDEADRLLAANIILTADD